MAFGSRYIARRTLILGAIRASALTREHNLFRWDLRLRNPASLKAKRKMGVDETLKPVLEVSWNDVMMEFHSSAAFDTV